MTIGLVIFGLFVYFRTRSIANVDNSILNEVSQKAIKLSTIGCYIISATMMIGTLVLQLI